MMLIVEEVEVSGGKKEGKKQTKEIGIFLCRWIEWNLN